MTEFPIIVASEQISVGGLVDTVNLETDVGPAGRRGAIIFSGSGEPTSESSVDPAYGTVSAFQPGDLYIRQDEPYQGHVYIYKELSEGSEWVEILSLYEEVIEAGAGSPEGSVEGSVGELYTDNQNGHLYIKTTASGTTGWVQLESATSGSGDVNGPGSSTDNALARFDGTGGKTVQNSGITVDDSGYLSAVSTMAPISADSTGAADPELNFKDDGVVRWRIISDTSAAHALRVLRYSSGGSYQSDVLGFSATTGKATIAAGATAGLELGSSGPRMMSGTGSPEGVVTAPVGSIWFQADSTVGVTHWKKASGTGNTGWVVMEGDTGNRDISGDATANATDTLNTVQIRRIGANVYLTLNLSNTSTSTTHELFATLPSGFRPLTNVAQFINIDDASSASKYTVVSVAASDGLTKYRNNDAGTHGGVVTWITNDAWPTSLPGTAA